MQPGWQEGQRAEQLALLRRHPRAVRGLRCNGEPRRSVRPHPDAVVRGVESAPPLDTAGACYPEHHAAGHRGHEFGALAGAVAGCLTTPLDAAKTRIMTTVRREERRGLLETMQTLQAESGIRGLFRGVVPRTVQCGIGGALWLGAFEWSSGCMR